MKRLHVYFCNFSHLPERLEGILVHSHEIRESELPRQLISDVAVINWVERRNFK